MTYTIQTVEIVDWETHERRMAYQIVDAKGVAIDWPVQFDRKGAELDVRDFNNLNKSQDESIFEREEIERQLGGI